MLSFTSIKSTLEFHQLPRDSEGAYPGILIRSKFWGPLEEVAYDYASIHFKETAVVVPRSWYYTRDKKKIPLESEDNATHALGVLGMTPQETRVTGIESCLKAGRWFRLAANVKFVDRIELCVGRGQDNRPADDESHDELHQRQEE